MNNQSLDVAGRRSLLTCQQFQGNEGLEDWSKLKSKIILRSIVFSKLVDSYAFKWKTCIHNVGLQWKYGTEKGWNDERSPRGDVKEWTGSNDQWNYTDEGKELFLMWERHSGTDCSFNRHYWVSFHITRLVTF